MDLAIFEGANFLLFFESVPLRTHANESQSRVSDRRERQREGQETHVERRKIEIGRSVVDVGIVTIRIETRVSDASRECKEKRSVKRRRKWMGE